MQTIKLTRWCKISLVAAVAGFAWLVAYNNVVDYGSNFAFVQHVLTMDTTFEGNQLTGRAITNPTLHHAAYALIIVAEAAVGLLCSVGAVLLWRQLNATNGEFNAAKGVATCGLVLGILLWFGGFMTVGAEWFLMWQSQIWNGQQPAFRFAMVLFACLLFLHQQEPQSEP
ncbi:DUF2165 domain-containing protein [Neiella marina]|uniref:DUF2165 domain-containing protein n=1 Tax=Neiella holothuriorum TaxID=2870530 RepID=A0ABS7EC17_9GAMM|nr:DUF2165 domain-containing protein [Neiella holothuriorum]MBW8189770.1 DUF2165 domain-containing protein [Neiella holothuriorum]